MGDKIFLSKEKPVEENAIPLRDRNFAQMDLISRSGLEPQKWIKLHSKDFGIIVDREKELIRGYGYHDEDRKDEILQTIEDMLYKDDARKAA